MTKFAKVFLKFSLIFSCAFFIACDNGTDGGDKGIKNCPEEMKGSIAEYLADIEGIKKIASDLNDNKMLYPFRALKNFSNDKPIFRSYLHCPQLTGIPQDKCQSGDKTLDIKTVKDQCGKLKLILDAYQKFSTVDGATKREALTAQEEKDVKAYIDLIINGFGSGA
jgi:hypothetical protein